MPSPGSDRDTPSSWLSKARYGALKMGVPVSCADHELTAAPSSASTRIPPQTLRRMRLSLYVFGHHAYPIVHDLKEPTANFEPAHRVRAPHRQRPLAQQRHERSVIRQDADLAVEGRRHDGVRFTVEHRGLRRDNRDLHHELASFLAFSTASSIAPTM